MRLLGDISRLNAKRFPEKCAFRCGEQILSFAEADRLANRLAGSLLAAGVRRGDRVALLSPNSAEYIPLFFGILKAGAVCVPLNCRSLTEELAYFLSDCGAGTLIFAPAFSGLVEGLHSQAPALRKLVATEAGAAVRSAIELAAFVASAPAQEPAVIVDEQDSAAIFYTSGTTGRPKGVVLTHRSLMDGTRETVLAMRIRHDDVALVSIPLFHGGGLMVLAMPHLYVGAGLELMAKFDAAAALALIEEHKLTTFLGVAVQYSAMLEISENRRFDTGTLRSLWYGSAPMPLEVLKRCVARWPNADFFQTYGQTETTLIAALGPEEHDARFGFTGRELPGVEVRILDEDGAQTPIGGVGEVVVRAENGMKEYFGKPAETAEVLRDGWIYTGDLARVEDGGYFTLVDRKRDVIISGGENVYPKEIEAALYAHPAVVHAAVIGVSDAKWGEVPCAYLVLNAGADPDPSTFEEWCAARLARYKRPRHWKFVDTLPMNASGKVQKNILRQKAHKDG